MHGAAVQWCGDAVLRYLHNSAREWWRGSGREASVRGSRVNIGQQEV